MAERVGATVLVVALCAILLPHWAGAQEAPSRVVVGLGTDVTALDPHFKIALPDYILMYHIFDTLVFRNDKMEFVPKLAESWRLISDRTWQFKLRRGVRFHNGELFNAQAVKFTLERMVDPALKTRDNFWKEVTLERVDVIDDYTVNFVTSKPSAIMLTRLQYVYILAPQYYKSLSLADAARHPIGTGPFKFLEWVRDSHLTLEAFGDYWGGPAKISRITWRVIPEASSRVNELRTAGVHLIVQVPPDQVDEMENDPITRVRWVEGSRRIFVGIRSDRPPLNDRRVRQALNYGVDVDSIIRYLLGAKAKRMATPVNAPNNNPRLKPYEYDPKKAQSLLKEAGWSDTNGDGFLDKDGRTLSLTLDTTVGRFARDKEVAQAIAADLGKLGIRVTVKPLEFSLFTKRLADRDMDDLYFYGIGSAFDDQSELRTFSREYFLEATKWNNEEFEKLYVQFEGTMDPAKRRDLSYRLQQLVVQECPWIFLYRQVEYYGLSKRLDWEPRPDDIIYLYTASIRQ